MTTAGCIRKQTGHVLRPEGNRMGSRVIGVRSTRRRQQGAEAGFQVVELMVVLVIIGLGLAAAVPSFSRRNSWARAEGAARQLSGRMQATRQLALSRRVPYRLVLNRGAMTYAFERQENDSSWVRDPDRVYAMEGIAGLEGTIGGDASATEVIFEPRGTIDDASAPVELLLVTDHADTAALTVVRTGRATVRMSRAAE